MLNIIETAIYWKWIPDWTIILREEERIPNSKAANDHVTVLFCINLTDDLKCKRLLLHRAAKPKCI